MAQFQWDGTGETAGATTSLFANEWGGALSEWKVETDGAAESGGRVLEFNNNSGSTRRFISLIAAGILGDVRTDMRARFYRPGNSGSTSSLHVLRMFGAGAAASETGVNADIGTSTNADKARLNEYDGGTFSALADSGSGVVDATAGWFRMRLLYDPAATPNMSLYLWDDGDSEPASPQLTYDQTKYSGGKVGSGGFSAPTGSKLDWISIGTSGDNAVDLGSSDTTAPILTSPTGTAGGSSTASGTVSTDEAGGLLDAVVTTSATTPTAAQIQAGQDHTGSAASATDLDNAVAGTGSQSVSFSGLTASTTYYVHYVQQDAAGNDATPVSSASFATSAAVTEGIELTLYNGASTQDSLTGIHVAVWDATDPDATAPDFFTATATTNGSGVLSVDISGIGGIAVSDTVFVLLWKPDASVDEDSLAFAGRLDVVDIS